jgi:hypothetical protein
MGFWYWIVAGSSSSTFFAQQRKKLTKEKTNTDNNPSEHNPISRRRTPSLATACNSELRAGAAPAIVVTSREDDDDGGGCLLPSPAHLWMYPYIHTKYIHRYIQNTYIPSLCTIRIFVLKHLCLMKYVHMHCITCLYGICTYTDLFFPNFLYTSWIDIYLFIGLLVFFFFFFFLGFLGGGFTKGEESRLNFWTWNFHLIF